VGSTVAGTWSVEGSGVEDTVIQEQRVQKTARPVLPGFWG
jgi:hypothetical protein